MNTETKIRTAIMRPGILVSLRTSLDGGVSYNRVDLEHDRDASGADVARWETKRVIDDPEEHARAVKIRGKARSEIAKHCTPTSFGLLCRLDRVDELNEAVRRARAMCDSFNASATYSRVNVYVLTGRIAETQEEATRAIAREITDLLDEMNAGIRDVNPEAIRKAAAKAKAIGAMLDASKASAVQSAVAQARKAAREIVKRVEKGGEDSIKVAKTLSVSTKPIEAARFAFLDLDAPTSAEPKAATPRDVDTDTGPTLDKARAIYKARRDKAPDAETFVAAFMALCDGKPKDLTPAQLISCAERAAKGERPMPAVDMQRVANLEIG